MKLMTPISIALLLAAGGVASWLVFERSQRSGQLVVKPTAPSAEESLDDFLKRPDLPNFVRFEHRRFKVAIDWANEEAKKSGFEIHRNPAIRVEDDVPSLKAIPETLRGIFANPSIVWGRSSDGQDWEAALILIRRGEQDGQKLVLAHLTQALSHPHLSITSEERETGSRLGPGPWLDFPQLSYQEEWRKWGSQPLSFVWWDRQKIRISTKSAQVPTPPSREVRSNAG